MHPRDVLEIRLDPNNDSGRLTVGGYLQALLEAVWEEDEGFDGKRPFGNSGWWNDLYYPLAEAGVINGQKDADGYMDDIDDKKGHAVVAQAIRWLFQDYT